MTPEIYYIATKYDRESEEFLQLVADFIYVKSLRIDYNIWGHNNYMFILN